MNNLKKHFYWLVDELEFLFYVFDEQKRCEICSVYRRREKWQRSRSGYAATDVCPLNTPRQSLQSTLHVLLKNKKVLITIMHAISITRRIEFYRATSPERTFSFNAAKNASLTIIISTYRLFNESNILFNKTRSRRLVPVPQRNISVYAQAYCSWSEHRPISSL